VGCEGALIADGALCAPYLRTRACKLCSSPSLVTLSGRLAANRGVAPRWHLFTACQLWRAPVLAPELRPVEGLGRSRWRARTMPHPRCPPCDVASAASAARRIFKKKYKLNQYLVQANLGAEGVRASVSPLGVPPKRKAFPSNMPRPWRMRGLQLVDSWSSRPREPFCRLTQVPKGRGAKRGELRGAARAGRAARAAPGGVSSSDSASHIGACGGPLTHAMTCWECACVCPRGR